MSPYTTPETHRWFRAAGSPLLISAHDRARFTLARSVPLLIWLIASTVLYLLLWSGLVTYVDEETSGGQPSDDVFLVILLLGTVLPPLALCVLPWQVAKLQKRYPLWVQNLAGALLAGLAVYSLSPSAAHLLGAHDLADLSTTNSAILTILLLVTGVFFGLDALLLWVLKQTRYELLSLITMVTKVLPVLMVAVLFFFVNGDIWRVADALSLQRTWQVVAVLAALAFLVIISTVTEKTRRMLGARMGDRLESYSEDEYALAAQQAGEAWVECLKKSDMQKVLNPPPLSRHEWYNLVSLPMVVQGIQALFFSLLTCIFFVWFGSIAIPDATVTSWLTHEATKASFAGIELPFTLVLLKVAMVLGAFAGLNFVAQTSSDARYADEFLEPAIEQVRRTVMVRNIYRARHGSRRC